MPNWRSSTGGSAVDLPEHLDDDSAGLHEAAPLNKPGTGYCLPFQRCHVCRVLKM